MAIEKLNSAAKEAQPAEINMVRLAIVGCTLPKVDPLRSPLLQTVVVVLSSPSPVQERQLIRQPYPNFKVVVLDDDFNTFQHVVESLVRIIPGMLADQAWELAHRIDGEGSAVVWCGPQEQAELYHQQLGAAGLTMAPLERA
jgi:ATP-dependent Clp protease adaptor protein ClpS